ncbi:MAG TPA: DUF2480 family protein [Flavobacterium sp.]|jgi:hypothetical protein|uniref:DUF2480 family protein n=1 Tax=Flavobacterium sp. TaxID=239 RepID=UPI001B70F088|nr:DUF2480 family protein [Flavobacterium sp.]MBP7182838.1 DUF2480 family protein [Flavobacterium sp.]MBP7316827.1 DUF2480 family protein [Flavobacterium sp.]MBP8886289.1 DUF2480 family protein [Flavobacterium sp.]HRL72520.1 DUF2480 family protein [Flavobacterium sp.]HRM11510.1 DUF2480 family protein [Flavobacterium sp.]
MEEIINKVANSALDVFDLEDYYPKGIRTQIDISQWLLEGFILREKDFREQLKNHDWSQYQDQFVAIHCSTDAIVPAWASILVAIQLAPFTKKIINGTIEDLEASLYEELLTKIDYSVYKNKPVIIKGCSKKPVPMRAYVLAAHYLQPFARSIMYGEACSAVPLYKAPKKG